MKILAVDDSGVIRKIMRTAADALEMQYLGAEDGVEALEVLENGAEDIGLVLLDWNMPGMNGFDLLVKLKADARYNKIPVMMVTTESERANIIAAVRAGASNYLTKPFSMEDLISKILESMEEDES
jgi:two-component system chemotaxis response regulator CheY